MNTALAPLPYYAQAVSMVAAAEHEIALAGIYTNAGHLPAATEACRRAHAAYLRATGLLRLRVLRRGGSLSLMISLAAVEGPGLAA